MKKLIQSGLKIGSFISKMQTLHRIRFNKVKEISKSYKTKRQEKFQKYEKPKPNIYNKKGFHKNCSKINQY